MIDGEKLVSIIGYAVTKMNITFRLFNDAKLSYQSYCTALQKEMGKGVSYSISRDLNTDNINVILQGMYNSLPMNPQLIPQKLKDIMGFAAGKASGHVDTKVHNFASLFHASNSKSFSESSFSVLKIFKNAENLEIIPAYMFVSGEKHKKRVLWIKKSWSKAHITYSQEKFVITKKHIQEIIKVIKNPNWSGH
jgi:hypothetical protein